MGKPKLNDKVNKIFLDFTTELKPLSNQTTVSILLIPVECRTLVRYEPCNDPTHNWFLCGSMSGHRSAESERWTCWILIEKAFLSPNFVGPNPNLRNNCASLSLNTCSLFLISSNFIDWFQNYRFLDPERKNQPMISFSVRKVTVIS